jgi:nuclear cap-binding protein subunit 1
MSTEFTKMYLWEILHLTIKKMNKHVMKLSAELAEAKDKLAKDADSSSSEDSDNDTSMVKKKKDENSEKPTEEVFILLNKGGLQTALPFPIAPLFVSSLKRFEL